MSECDYQMLDILYVSGWKFLPQYRLNNETGEFKHFSSLEFKVELASVSDRWPGEVTKEYGSRLVRGRKRIWLAACLRSQTNMACEPSEVTTEYVPLQYVSWLNMAHGLSEVVTEYGLRAF